MEVFLRVCPVLSCLLVLCSWGCRRRCCGQGPSSGYVCDGRVDCHKEAEERLVQRLTERSFFSIKRVELWLHPRTSHAPITLWHIAVPVARRISFDGETRPVVATAWRSKSASSLQTPNQITRRNIFLKCSTPVFFAC